VRAGRDLCLPADGLQGHRLRTALEPPSADEEITATRPEEPWRALLAACRRAVHEIAVDSEPDENEVLVYTIHAAKGQEWDHVYLAGAYEHGYRDRGGPAGEGLRRLYVGITRACESLTISKPDYAIGPPLEERLQDRSLSFPRELIEALRAVDVPIERLGRQE